MASSHFIPFYNLTIFLFFATQGCQLFYLICLCFILSFVPTSTAMDLEAETKREDELESQYQKGVRHLHEGGITKVPTKYIFPVSDRPNIEAGEKNLKLPVVDFAQLQGSDRPQVLKSLAKACEEYGFFQLTNHGIPSDIIQSMVNVSKQFFELPFEERAKYMSRDLCAPVRYGTSFNQNKDGIFCWRDLLKLVCSSLSDVLPYWPSSPVDFRQAVAPYTKQMKFLFIMLVEAILESLGLVGTAKIEDDDDILKEFRDGSQIVVINCYPSCPQPDLTLGMPPHTDYGFLTILLQDEVAGLQIEYEGKWVTVQPLPNSFVINVGDHLEIFSNGKYKSLLHRVLVNSSKSRLSVASLHSMPFKNAIRSSPRLINEANPRLYKDTDFASFLEYISSCEPKGQKFLESRKLNL